MIRRQRFLRTALAGAPAWQTLRLPARAAQFVYRLGHPNPVELASSVRTVQMAEAIKAETNGRLDIQVYPNSQLGSSTSMMTQLRGGAIQFLELAMANASGIVPEGGIENVGCAFKSEDQFYRAMDGALGAYLRAEFFKKGFYIFDRAFNLGARQMTASTHPIRNVDDLAGFKLRSITSPTVVDFWKTLGASAVPLDSNELYTSLQSHLLDGCDFPVGSILGYRVYEVQKYVSVTNHLVSSLWLTANIDAWNALGSEIQAVVTRNMRKYVAAQRTDVRVSTGAIVGKLKRLGLAFNDADVATMKARLGPYYVRCKASLGATPWGLLEEVTGKFA